MSVSTSPDSDDRAAKLSQEFLRKNNAEAAFQTSCEIRPRVLPADDSPRGPDWRRTPTSWAGMACES